MQDLLPLIQKNLAHLATQGDLQQTATQFWDTLGYRSNKTVRLTWADIQGMITSPTQAQIEAMPYVQEACMVFQVTESEMKAKVDMFAVNAYNAQEPQSYLFLACRLQDNAYKRETLATLTRLINKPFAMPVIVLFCYAGKASIGVINRRLNKKDTQKDVLEKVTLLKDIDALQPKRAQIDILQDLALHNLKNEHKVKVKNFVELHHAWQKVLDTKELNKRFFEEIANWYFWAVENARFPALPTQTQEQANQVAVIRLLTRLMFVWFIKEKGLVKDELFRQDKVQDYLTGFEDWQAFFAQEYDLKIAEKDKTKFFHSQYYKAVLQNVFFASLNADVKPQEKRFVEHCTKQYKDNRHSAGAVYRYRYFFKDEQKALQDLFMDIPFLNGGLFDALEQGNTKIDAFTNPIENQDLLSVPDFLFFAEERTDFSDALKKIYDIKDKKRVLTVKGILRILKRYKFTVQENTPLEEDVALDPELLGQIFENLLAYYNPETGATARKGTGSFYTPREIVDYMVEESLKAYLKIDDLTTLQQASQDEKERVIRQLAHIKILDPACGSGAFPMGVLHKVVDILKNTDKDNTIWRKIQKERAQTEIDLAYDIKEREERQARLQEIDEIFENNLEDYGRKLFIIQNCIYGVDIQNIAIQISKLRFFLSLVIEQNNEQIKPLPNLETKFVCANTLIALDKPKGQARLQNPKIEEAENELKRLRTQYFSVRNRAKKKEIIQKDAALRQELATLLQGDGWGKASAQKVASFDLFDQNANADWFDAEMMFGVKDSFDVVIGNPPYLRIQGLKDSNPKFVEYAQKTFKSATGSFDLYILFAEKSFNLVHEKGIVNFIMPVKWVNSSFGKGFREIILKLKNAYKIVSFESYQVFNASTYTALQWFKKGSNNLLYYQLDRDLKTNQELKDFLDKLPSQQFNKISINSLSSDSWILSNSSVQPIISKINQFENKVSNIFYKISQGLATGADDIFFLTDCKIINERLLNGFSASLGERIDIELEVVRPLIKGDQVHRYEGLATDLYAVVPYESQNSKMLLMSEKTLSKEYPKCYDYLLKNRSLLSKRENNRFDKDNEWYQLSRKQGLGLEKIPKLLCPYISLKSQFTIDLSGNFYTNTKCFSFVLNEHSNLSLQYCLSVLNSSVAWFFMQNTSVVFRGGYYVYSTEYISKFPIPPLSPASQKPFEQLVEYILWLKANPALPANEYVSNEHIAGQFEEALDAMVFELYFEESVKAKDADVLRYIVPEYGFVPFSPTMTDEEKRVTIHAVYEAYRQKEHEVRNNVILQKFRIPEIITIFKSFQKI